MKINGATMEKCKVVKYRKKFLYSSYFSRAHSHFCGFGIPCHFQQLFIVLLYDI